MIGAFGGHGDTPDQLQFVHDIAIGPDGAVYVAEGAGQRVQKFVRRK